MAEMNMRWYNPKQYALLLRHLGRVTEANRFGNCTEVPPSSDRFPRNNA